MSYSIYDPCEGQISDPICDPCLDDVELGRVRGVAFIHRNYVDTLNADPTDDTIWATGVEQGMIKIIPKTTGTYDGGSPVEAPGFGDTETKIIGYKFVASYRDPSLKGNTAFYNSIKRSSVWHFAFRTETLTRISQYPATVIPKAPVEEDMTSQSVWNVDVKFNQADHPVPFDTPVGVFECSF
jgi:hypothetical protein